VKATPLSWDVALLLLAGTGLSAGLTRLATAPLSAVLIILAAMGLLMFPAASLSGAAMRPTGLRKNWKSTYTPRRRFRFHDHDKEK
jgi:hypothetical protein